MNRARVGRRDALRPIIQPSLSPLVSLAISVIGLPLSIVFSAFNIGSSLTFSAQLSAELRPERHTGLIRADQ